eukprot:164188-Pelagomonas_calceolata.AAC.2
MRLMYSYCLRPEAAATICLYLSFLFLTHPSICAWPWTTPQVPALLLKGCACSAILCTLCNHCFASLWLFQTCVDSMLVAPLCHPPAIITSAPMLPAALAASEQHLPSGSSPVQARRVRPQSFIYEMIILMPTLP